MTLWRTPSPEPAAADEVGTRVSDDLIPLSHLQLDMPEPAEGWSNYLARRGIAFRPDRLGRDSITFGEAKRLLDEAREHELRRRRLLAVQEAEAVEQDQRRRAELYKGIPWHAVPADVSPASAMLQAARDERPRRKSLVETAFEGGSMIFHELPKEAE